MTMGNYGEKLSRSCVAEPDPGAEPNAIVAPFPGGAEASKELLSELAQESLLGISNSLHIPCSRLKNSLLPARREYG